MNLGAIVRIELAESNKVLAKASAGARRALMKQGAYLRTVAKRSISTKPKPSRPGHPPRSVTGLLRDFLIFRFDQSAQSIVVGPAFLSGSKVKPTIPEILETGGVEMSMVRRGRGYQRRPVAIAPRPYMAPALERSQQKLSQFWKDSLLT